MTGPAASRRTVGRPILCYSPPAQTAPRDVAANGGGLGSDPDRSNVGGIVVMQRISAAAAVLALLAVAACQKSGSGQGQGVSGVTSIAGMVADPEREVVYLGDAAAGRVVVLSTADGSVQQTLRFGATIGGLAVDHCVRKLYVSVTGGRRIDVVDCVSLQKTGSIALAAFPYAVASGANDHVVVATSRGLLDVDPATGTTTTLQAAIDPHAMLCSNRAGDSLFVVTTDAGSASVERIDLLHTASTPVRSPDHALPGTHVGVALSYAEDRLYVATDGSSGAFQLDAGTLVPTQLLPLGPNLASIAVNPTSTRLYFSRGDLEVESVNLDHLVGGASYDVSADVQQRGLFVAANGLSLLAHDADQSVQSHYLFDVHLNGPSAVRQKVTYGATIEGPPNAVYYLFASGDPGYVYLDPPTHDDPRFLDLALGSGFTVLSVGVLDGAGHADFQGKVPEGLVDEATIIFQAVAQTQPGKHFAEIGNPLMVRFLGAGCTNGQ